MEVTNKSFSPALVEHLRAALKRALFVSFDLVRSPPYPNYLQLFLLSRRPSHSFDLRPIGQRQTLLLFF